MTAEMGHGNLGFWFDDDRSAAMAFLGPHAFEYLTASHLAADGLVTAVVGDLVLDWDDDHRREREDEESGSRSGYDKLRKLVLQKLHLPYGGSDDENYAINLDCVTDAEIFFLASMYFSFPVATTSRAAFSSTETLGFRRTGVAYISNVAVRESERRKGISKMLIAKAEAKARSWGCRSVALHCDPSNLAAARLYKGQGYRIIKVSKEARWPQPVTSPNEEFDFMMKLLSPLQTSSRSSSLRSTVEFHVN